MIWLYTFLYFFLYSILLLLGSFLYGEILLFAVRRKNLQKNVLIFLAYFIFTIFVVSPIFLVFDFIQGVHEYILYK